MTRGNWAVTVSMLAAAFLFPRAAFAQGLTAEQLDDRQKTVRVAAPGKFETAFTLRKGFGASWFDLAHDPEKKRNLAPVADENGLYWVKMAKKPPADFKGDLGSYYANPAKTIELVESGPVRARVKLTGWQMRYGRTDEPAAYKDVPFELTHTVYPTGAVYADYAIDAAEDIPLHHFLTIVKSNGAWGKNGKGEGKGEAHCVTEGGDGVPGGRKTPAAFVLQWTNGPTYFADMLLAYYKGRFGTAYWDEGYQDQDYRAGLDIMGMFPDRKLAKGRTHILFLFRIGDDMNSAAEAAPYANDYRAPDALAVTTGAADKSDPGDLDADGFNESEGCYVLKAAEGGAAFTLHGKETPRMKSAFKVKGWPSGAVASVTLAGKKLDANKDYLASVKDGVALVLLLMDVRDDSAVTLSAK